MRFNCSFNLYESNIQILIKMMLLKTLVNSWQMILVLSMILIGIESLEAAKFGRIKDKNDFTIAQKHATVQEMADFQMSLSPTLIKKDGKKVNIE